MVEKKVTKKEKKVVKKNVKPELRSFSSTRINKLSSIIRYPLSTEKSLKYAEYENKLLFIVDIRSSKKDIKDAIEAMFKVKVKSVNTSVTVDGLKKAYVKFDPSVNATDVATNLGML